MCAKFKELPVNKRVTLVREAKLCFNCLSQFHMANKCRSTHSCQKCKKRHNTLLHYEAQYNSGSEEKTTSNDNNGATLESAVGCSKASLTVHHSNGHVFLPTVVALVTDKHGAERSCRAILDSGSQINFVSKRLANLLQLPHKKVDLPVSGIGANQVQSYRAFY